MNNPTLFKTAVILFTLLSIGSIIFSVAAPSITDGIPPVILVLATILGAAGLVSAWGAWQGQKWGIWLTILLCVLHGLSALPGVLGGPNNIARVSATVFVIIPAFVIIVLLRYRPIATQS